MMWSTEVKNFSESKCKFLKLMSIVNLDGVTYMKFPRISIKTCCSFDAKHSHVKLGFGK